MATPGRPKIPKRLQRKPVTVTLSAEMIAWIRDGAARAGVSISAHVNALLSRAREAA